MKIEWNEQTLHYDPTDATVAQAIAIRDYLGCGMVKWSEKISEGQPEALQAVMWLMKQQNDMPTTEIKDEEFSVGKFYEALTTSIVNELNTQIEKAEAAGGRPKGRTRKQTPTLAGTGRAGSVTSRTSATSGQTKSTT